MKSLDEEDRVGVMNPIFAVLDRERRDAANKEIYSAAQRKRGLQIKEAAWTAYDGLSQVYLNFQEGHMTVKVAAPRSVQKNRDAVATFNGWCMSQGIQILNTTKGVLYRFV